MNLKTAFLSLVACSFFAAETAMGETPEQVGSSVAEVFQVTDGREGKKVAEAEATGILYMTDIDGKQYKLERKVEIKQDITTEGSGNGVTLVEAINDMLSGLGQNTNPLVIAALEAARDELMISGFTDETLKDGIQEAITKAANENNKKDLDMDVQAATGSGSTGLAAFSEALLGKEVDVNGCMKGFVMAAAGIKTNENGSSKATAIGMWVSWNTCADEEERNGGVFDDPHFKTWGGKYFSYHGQCDLVMMENPSFGDGLGLDLHIRTTIEDYYSAITSAALRIGSDVIEIDAHDVYFNSQKVTDGDKPTSIAGFPIDYIPDPKGKMRTEITVGKNNKKEKIVFRWKKGFMGVLFESPSKKNFEGSYGVLGTFEFGLLVGRDGFTEFENTSEFVEQWQVKDTDDKLFHDLHRAPQYPMRCIMPQVSETKVRRRRLQKTISREQAAEACAHWPKQGQESCIFDVMMTGDLEMADDPF